MERRVDVGTLFEALRGGDRVALGRAITLVESTRPSDRTQADDLLSRAQVHAGRCMRLGITGIPGVGKSTLIDALGREAIANGRRVAVLATDPTSVRSHGSILGDKTRMESLSRSEQAFIRPTPSGGHLGGVARRTRETMLICEAAGHDLILIETVGVGQSELAVDGMTDLNLLLMIPGAGDELQGIKRGIMESADVIVLTKADGLSQADHQATRNALRNAIGFLPARESGRHPDVLITDALSGKGIAGLWELATSLHDSDERSGFLAQRRQEQNSAWLHQAIRDGLLQQLMLDPDTQRAMNEVEHLVRSGELSPFTAAQRVLDRFRKGA
jgi:LAO/AO transport system kinase